MNPNEIAPGHNPNQLTNEQVGEGWRLLSNEERNCLKQSMFIPLGIHIWMGFEGGHSGWSVLAEYSGCCDDETYGTQKHAGYFLTYGAKPVEPTPEPEPTRDDGGLAANKTLRDYFAAKVINALLAGENPNRLECEPEQYSTAAYKIADAMLKERAK